VAPPRWFEHPHIRRQELRAKLRAINAQTTPKTQEHQTPESKTNQQDREPSEICKTSIPGSNPGGASNILRKTASFVLAPHNRVLVNGLESLLPRHSLTSQVADS
jgi:hypothetical protein